MKTEDELLKKYYSSIKYLKKRVTVDPLINIIDSDIRDSERLLMSSLVEREEIKSISEYYNAKIEFCSQQRLKHLEIEKQNEIK